MKKLVSISFLVIIYSLISSLNSLYAEAPVEPTLNKPQFIEPESGITVNKTFNIVLDYVPNKNCISIKNDATTFFISKQLLKQLETYAKNIKEGVAETNRILLIQGERAKLILSHQLEKKGKFGCSEINNASLPQDVIYLIQQLLNSGQIAVLDNKKNKLSKKITVRYSAKKDVIGHISYFTKTIPSKSILLIRWWIK